MAQKAGVSLPSRFEPATKRDEKEKLYQVNEAAAQYFHDLLLSSKAGAEARDYLNSRGLSPSTITSFQLGYSQSNWEALQQHLTDIGYTREELLTAGLVIEADAGGTHDRFRNRLMFPIHDIKGRTTGFGARALDDSTPKYINSPETPLFDKSSCLYGIDLAREAIRQQDRAVIVEGYMDVIAAHDNGFGNVVASMGIAVTEKQINILKKLTKNIIFALDADSAGEEATLRGVNYENTIDAEVNVAILPQGKDPDEVIRESKEAWQHLLDEAIPIIDYTFDRVIAELDLSTARDKSLVVDSLLPVITQVNDPVRQAHYLQKLAHLVNISEKRLEMVIESNKISRSQPKLRVPQKPVVMTNSRQTLIFNPLEEYCLAMLLQHPELKGLSENIMPEHFENSENREIFNLYQRTENTTSIKDELDNTIWEHFDNLIKRDLLSNQAEKRLSDCILRLREEFLRRLERKREAVFASEAASKGSAAELNKLEEQGTEGSAQLRDIFIQRSRGGQKQRRNG